MRNGISREFRRVRLALAAPLILCGCQGGPAAQQHPAANVPAEKVPAQTQASRPDASPFTVALLPYSAMKNGAPDGLAGSAWLAAMPRNILGAGAETHIRFKEAADRTLRMESETLQFRSFQDKQPLVLNRHDEPCRIAGPVLHSGDQQQTFVLIPGQTLALNALVPVGDGQWYYCARMVYGENPADPAQPRWRDEEMMITFADDPLTHDAGNGSIRIRSGTPKILEDKVRFTLDKADPFGRQITIQSTGATAAKWAQILIPPDGRYGILEDAPNSGTRLYAPAQGAGHAPAPPEK
ncbi:MAG TPA: hypothetical protein VG269_18595 [Tepidisphaeraceae bacterium]|jgi:hypothetical protein|nr:hypothetical protein [Tepidisphaeraceae bacterium]